MWSRETAQLAAFAVVFGIAAALSRYVFTVVETRIQTLTFIYFAASYEWVARPLFGQKPNLLRAVLNASAATTAIIVVRWRLEGLCPGLYQAGCIPTL